MTAFALPHRADRSMYEKASAGMTPGGFLCYPDRSGRSQFHGMRKKKHGCHTGDAEDKPIMPASPASVKAKTAAGRRCPHRCRAREHTRSPQTHICPRPAAAKRPERPRRCMTVTAGGGWSPGALPGPSGHDRRSDDDQQASASRSPGTASQPDRRYTRQPSSGHPQQRDPPRGCAPSSPAHTQRCSPGSGCFPVPHWRLPPSRTQACTGS